MKALKIVVERIVRPIAASELRKNKMREELLAHLYMAYEEALAANEHDPVATAALRLGDPNILREELQAAVPRSEQYTGGKFVRRLFHHLEATFDPGNPAPYRHCLKASLYMTAVYFATLFPMGLLSFSGIAWISKGTIPGDKFVHLAGVLMLIGGAMALCHFSCVSSFIVLRLHHLVRASSKASPIWKGLVLTTLVLGFAGLFLLLLAWVLGGWPPQRIPYFVAELGAILAREPVAYLIPIGLFTLTTWAFHVERRQFQAWGSLEIDE
ncbi:MAG: hypothetical protein HYV27_18935 [Candidatus Hydrogenedentes bacterium]|nr:hypothetical protein [Candidatus Hydrogenedentota bacterium]